MGLSLTQDGLEQQPRTLHCVRDPGGCCRRGLKSSAFSRGSTQGCCQPTQSGERHHSGQTEPCARAPDTGCRACAGLQGLGILTHCPTCNWQGPVTSPVTLRLAEQLLFLHAAARPVPIASRPTPPQAGSRHPLQPLSSSALSGTEQHQCWVSTKGQEDGEEHHS